MPHRRVPRCLCPARSWIWAVSTLAITASCAAATPAEPWATGAEWFSVRAGYAKSSAVGAPDGNVGFGFSYTRFHNTKWAYGSTAEWNVLGRFGSARELEIPWTVETSRHYKWPTTLRPFVGAGLGLYYHQLSGTGDDRTRVRFGGFLGAGFNTLISDRGLLGLDVRMNIVQAAARNNPVFGSLATAGERQSEVPHWGVKLGYSWVF